MEELELLVDEEVNPDDFVPNPKDARFSAIKTHDFHIDPTNQEFDRT